MSKNQITQYTPEINEAFKPEVLQVIRNSIAPTANDQEFLLFAHKAAAYGLDPFKNEIFFIKYGNTARIQFAAEAYLSKAREQEGFQPPDTQMVHENDEFKVAMNKETKELEVVLHEIGFPRGKIIGAYSIAYRAGYRPVTVILDIEEVEHMFTGQNKDNWKKWTSDMFGKHVQQRALKKQYGLDFGDEEIQLNNQENDIPEYQPKERKDITPNQDVLDSKPINEEATNQTDDEIKKIRSDINNLFKRIGVKTKEEMSDYISKHAPKVGENPSISDLVGLKNILEMQLEMQEAQAADSDELE
ncbi:RecT family recombinase [Metabacillus halosaccharovorans]|uniref:RecT family recombinase n=1 Tax=Metabacillus halosaccharovorans TaxID=930124 RepID=UPI001475EF2B|nr:RecT family recombinase [Metabacillus halosaccharovorans]